MNELRHERERGGWSLDDVADRTRIPRPYLEALEDGNRDVLPPGPVLPRLLSANTSSSSGRTWKSRRTPPMTYSTDKLKTP